MKILSPTQTQTQNTRPNFEGYYRSKLGRSIDEFVKAKKHHQSFKLDY